jgi:hypothetical protein
MASNFDAALKAEMKRVSRRFHAFTSEQRADRAASFRLGYQQRREIGEFFYVHPDFPNTAFQTRSRAARAALALPTPPQRRSGGVMTASPAETRKHHCHLTGCVAGVAPRTGQDAIDWQRDHERDQRKHERV